LTTIIGVIVVIVVAALIAFGLTLMNGGKKPGPGGAPGGGGGFGGFGGGRRAPITVGTAKAVIGQIPISLDALGTVTPPVTATIASRIAGTLMSVNFKEGQMVRKGQLLAQIDPRPYKVAQEQAQGTLAHDQALLADARLDLKRYQTLLAQQSIASQQVDTQAALVKQDEGQVTADQAGVDNAKLNLAYTSITAPVAGRVGLRQVDVGNYIPVGSTTGLVVITVVDPMDVEFSVPEDNIPKIMQRQKQGAILPATALNRDGGQQLAVGTLSTLDTQIDVTTGTVKAKARFNNADGALYPQQFVNIHLLMDTLCNVVVVPTTAVRHGAQGDYVYSVQPNKTAHVQYVKTGPGTPETVSIQSGVAVGDLLITDGGDRLNEGSPVILPGDKIPAFQGAGAGAGRGGRHRGGQSGQHRFGGGAGVPGAGTGDPSAAAPSGGPLSGPASAQSPNKKAPDNMAEGGSCPGGQGQGGPGHGGHGHHGQGGAGQDGQTPPGQAPLAPSGQTGPAQAGGGQGGWRHRQGQGRGQGQSETGDGSAG
jgi:multidrug efflux system membrane fusion protein